MANTWSVQNECTQRPPNIPWIALLYAVLLIALDAVNHQSLLPISKQVKPPRGRKEGEGLGDARRPTYLRGYDIAL